MPAYVCEVSTRSYRYKRNLKRHKNEKHSNLEYWNCIEVNCRAKFIRRSYLSKHIISIHGYTSLRGREMACRAPRGDRVQQTYYEDISEDDSVFDLIDDMERLRSQDERTADFELNHLDNITLGHVDEVNNNDDWNDYDAGQMDDQNGIVLGDVINGGNVVNGSDAANVEDSMNYGNMVSGSDGDIVERDEAAGIAGGSINDGVSVSGNDAGIVGVSVNDGSSVYGGVSGSDNDARIVGDSVNDGSSVYGGMSVSGSDAMNSEDSVDGGVSLNSENAVISDNSVDGENAVVSDNSVDGKNAVMSDDSVDGQDVLVDDYEAGSYFSDSVDGFTTGDSWNGPDSDNEGDNSAIVIDSDDGVAVVRSTLKTRTQTFVYTVRRETKYIGGQEVNSTYSTERDYYEKWN